MKPIKHYYFHLLCLSLPFLIFSCSEEDPSLNITQIQLSSASQIVLRDAVVALNATNQDGIDISNEVTFSVDGVEIEGAEFTPSELGILAIRAEYADVKSEFMSMEVIENVTSLTFSATSQVIKPIGTDTTFFQILNQNDKDVTDLVTIYKEGELYRPNYYVSEDFESVSFNSEFYDVTSNTFELGVDLNPVSLTLSASKPTFDANGFIGPDFIVTDEDGDEITRYVDIYYNNELVVDGHFTTTVVGDYEFTAVYGNVTSNSFVMEAVPRNVRKVLIEEFTGEWCGWCPMAAYNIDELIKDYNGLVLTTGIHNGDGLVFSREALLRSAFGINYFPSGVVGREFLGQSVAFNGVTLASEVIEEVENQLFKEEVHLGLDVKTTIEGDNVLIDVDVEFYSNLDEELRLTIYLIENDVISGDQENYFSGNAGYVGTYYYDQPATIENYEHQYVLREAGTDIYGEVIAQSEVEIGNVYSFPQTTMSLTGFNVDKCYIQAFVHYSLEADSKKILNAEEVQVGFSTGQE